MRARPSALEARRVYMPPRGARRINQNRNLSDRRGLRTGGGRLCCGRISQTTGSGLGGGAAAACLGRVETTAATAAAVIVIAHLASGPHWREHLWPATPSVCPQIAAQYAQHGGKQRRQCSRLHREMSMYKCGGGGNGRLIKASRGALRPPCPLHWT